jgi:hypothetical protein
VVSPPTNLIENRKRTSIKLLPALTKGFLGCLGEEGELAYEFLYRKRLTRYYRLVCGGLEGVCGRLDAVSG